MTEPKEEDTATLPVRLFDEADDKIENRGAYEVFAMRALDIAGERKVSWFNHDGKNTMFLYKGGRERVKEQIDKGKYIDFSATDERLAYYKPFLWVWYMLADQSEKIKKIAKELKIIVSG